MFKYKIQYHITVIVFKTSEFATINATWTYIKNTMIYRVLFVLFFLLKSNSKTPRTDFF